MNTIRVAVIGTGNMGYAHSNHLYAGNTAGMKLTAICDIDPAKRANCAEHFPGIQCFEDYHQLLSSGAADAVIVVYADSRVLESMKIIVQLLCTIFSISANVSFFASVVASVSTTPATNFSSFL